MVSTFFGFSISMRALMAAQKGLEVTAHNIANANTPGYSRQRPELIASNPIMYSGMNRPGGVPLQLGTGVDVNSIERLRDLYLDHVIRQSTSEGGTYYAKETGFSRLEVVLNEPNDQGISSVVTEFFNSFTDLSNQPELLSERANVREKAVNLAESFNQLDTELKNLKAEHNQAIIMSVEEINNITGQIGDLNIQIATVESIGDNANDLKDARDLLVDRLSELVNTETIERPNGDIGVALGGVMIVDKGDVIKLTTKVDLAGNSGNVGVFFENGIKPQIIKGELKGLIEMRDITIPQFQNKLNNFASSLMNRINSQHKEGYGLDGQSGRAIFDDYRTATMAGTLALPPGTTLETRIDELGITEGNFFVQGKEIVITKDDAKPAQAITLGELINRINDAQPSVRASLSDDYTGIRLNFDLYNPADVSDTITIHPGTTNFLTDITGMTDAKVVAAEGAKTYTNAMDMFSVSLAVMDNLDLIAAAGVDDFGEFAGVGDNSNAISISELNDKLNAVDDSSFSDYYNGVIGILGSQAQTNDRLVTNQTLMIQQLQNQRDAVSSVSIDEESLNMIQYQRAFEGAAKVSSTLDSMIQTIIFDLGV